MTDEEEATERLLRLAGPLRQPDGVRSARVREAVHAGWRAHHRRRRVLLGLSVGAGALAAAAAVVVMVVPAHRQPGGAASAAVVATVDRLQGDATRRIDGGPAMALAPAASLSVADALETGVAARIALRMSDGSSVRIDEQSRVRLIAPAIVEVDRGAVYVATSEGSRGLVVRTAIGELRDIGTRFEVRLTPGGVRLRVRSGMVEIRRPAGVTSVAGGTEAAISPGAVAIQPLSASAAEWLWTLAVAPPLEIEGRSLRAFLESIAAERGWRVTYADRRAEGAAAATLHGSVAGLSADEVLDVAVTSAGLAYRVADGAIVVTSDTAR